MVVVARKANQPQIFFGQDRFVIQCRDATPDFFAWQLTGGRGVHYESGLPAPPERHQYAAARLCWRAVGRRLIVKFARQRHVDGDFENRSVIHYKNKGLQGSRWTCQPETPASVI